MAMAGRRPPRAVLLLTRPETDSRRFAALLPEWRAVIAPILRIVPVAHDAARVQGAAGLVFTSAHAVGSAGQGRGRLAICVGGHTAEVARQAGFAVQQGNGFAESLLPLIASADVPLVHPHGQHLAKRLPVDGVIVYDQVEQPLTAEAQQVLAGDAPVVAPLFSPRSARLLADAAQDARAPLWPVAISAAAMAAWHGPAAGRAVAEAPDVQGMAAAVAALPIAEHSP